MSNEWLRASLTRAGRPLEISPIQCENLTTQAASKIAPLYGSFQPFINPSVSPRRQFSFVDVTTMEQQITLPVKTKWRQEWQRVWQ
eukprot:gnl/Chilomastix_caulleri/1987.p1 GENE.gnl/Chilomastix_caulleri/1987~~gnl/Chilomastix_caulleri/1987.p1  ORF type:complete len:86 (+),score=18.64 gnl/Chilomastix_caulleri/1987:202-459(+)